MKYLTDKKKILELILGVTFFYLLIDNVFFTTTFKLHQVRDILRSWSIMSGDWIWVGSEASGGGHTFGPFYYYLLAIPQALVGKSWFSLYVEMVFLASLSSYLLFKMVEERADLLRAVCFCAILFAPGPYINQLRHFWNPSYLYIFIVLFLYFFENHQRVAKKYSLLFGVAFSLATQIHFSFILAVIALTLRLIFEKKGREKLPFLWLGMLLPMVPYFILLITRESIPPSDAPYSSSYYLLKDFVRGLGYLSQEKFKDQLLYVGNGFFYCVTPFAVLFAVISLIKKRFVFNKWVALDLLIMGLPIIDVMFNRGVGYSTRYLIPFFVYLLYMIFTRGDRRCILLAFFPALLIGIWQYQNSFTFTFVRIEYIVAALMGIAVVILLYRRTGTGLLPMALAVGAVIFFNFPAQSILGSQQRWNLPMMKELSEKILADTNWTYDELRERLFVLNFHNGRSLEIIYRELYEEKENSNLEKAPGGVMLIAHSRIKSFFTVDDIVDYLAHHPTLEETIKADFVAKKYIVTYFQEMKDYYLIYYRPAGEDISPEAFQNVSYTYDKSPGLEYWNELKRNPPTAILEKKICNEDNYNCIVSLSARLVRKEDSKLVLKTAIIGKPLENYDIMIDVYRSASVRWPYVEALCEGGERHRIELAAAVGYYPNISLRTPHTPANHINQGPFFKNVTLPCSKVVEVGLGWKSFTHFIQLEPHEQGELSQFFPLVSKDN